MTANVQIRFDATLLQGLVATASKKQLYRASALVMRMARQKIRKRKLGRASAPGNPPFKHRSGANDFGHSIRFDVDAAGTTAVIGPQREAGQSLDEGGPVPAVLEFGGRGRRGQASMWFRRKNTPKTNAVSGIAAWLKTHVKHGPLFAGENLIQVIAEARGGIKRRRMAPGRDGTGKWILTLRKQKAPVKGGRNGQYKLIYYYYVPIRTIKQAHRAAENIVKYFGYPVAKAGRIAPRPFMAPTLRENQNRIAEFWRNSVSG